MSNEQGEDSFLDNFSDAVITCVGYINSSGCINGNSLGRGKPRRRSCAVGKTRHTVSRKRGNNA